MIRDLFYTFRMGSAIILSALTRRPRMFSIQIMLNYTCNLKCAYCSAPRSKEVLELAALKEILRYLKKTGTLQISYAGGEPTIHPDYSEIIRLSRKSGFYITVSTNGFDSAPIIGAAEETRPHFVSVSLDGPADIHDRCRGAGTWERALTTLRLLQKKGIPRAINAVIGKHNCGIENMKWLFNTAEELRANFSFQWMLPNFGTQKEHDSLTIEMPQMKRLVNGILKIPRRGRKRLVLGDPILKELLTWDSLTPFYRTNPGKECFAGTHFAFITPSSVLAPCSLLESHPRYKTNNLFTVGFDAAFDVIKKIPCNDCYLGCNMLRNNIFSLNPRTLKNALNMVLRS